MDFTSAADDFFVNLDLQTTLALPDSRETILQFCEAVQKKFQGMASFYQRDSGQYVLEGDRDSGSYQWMELQSHQLSAGYFNPPDLPSAYELHSWLLDRVVYFLGIGGLDVRPFAHLAMIVDLRTLKINANEVAFVCYTTYSSFFFSGTSAL